MARIFIVGFGVVGHRDRQGCLNAGSRGDMHRRSPEGIELLRLTGLDVRDALDLRAERRLS